MKFPVEDSGAAWYALTVKPRHEKATARNLDRKGLESFLPLYRAQRRWSDRRKTVELCLFPGYVFCRFDYARQLDVLSLPAVRSVVGFGGAAAPVPEEEIEAIKSILASGRRVWPWPYLRAGQRVRIARGALAGLEGILAREKDTWRVVVNVELLRRSVAVEIDRDMVSPPG